MNITSNEIRQKFLEFFKSKNHEVIPSAPVVPDNDPTVLFTTAGMHPLVPYLLGEDHPLGKRLANYQKCVRTGDIDDVGDNTHLTFFEMLGNWSLGDYFKKESIAWSYEFLTSKDWLGIDSKKIAVTVFEGDENAPRDDESASIWQSFGITNISYLGKDDNWWGPAGQTGPCGPDTEIFYRVGSEEFPPVGSTVGNDPKNWMEIWNNVFMEYIKDENDNYNKAAMQNVDTGMGLERITRTLTGVPSVYESDIFGDIIEVITSTLGKEYNEETKKSVRIIADHTRTAVMMISDGVIPVNVDQGYVLRRLLRRAIREGHKLGSKGQFLTPIASKIISKFEEIYEGVKKNKQTIINEIEREEKQFLSTLENGLKEFDKLIKGFDIAFERTGKKIETISGDKAFKLYDTYGFPLEMTKELAEERGLKVDEEGFKEAFKKHQELSRAGSEQKFKGGLADNSEMTTSLHSATHLMLAGLRKVLGTHIHQAGSNITAERLRFDFTHPEKVTQEELKQVEDYVNEAISKNAKVVLEMVAKKDAENDPTIEASFWEKYPDVVKVYTFKSDDGEVFSKELCGGPHVELTGSMGKFKILKEEASSRGVRRIKAILEK
ncbi:MAG: alanine--tRNA ligase [Candidatus Gracilibacteria bacterium]|nr:alanine--tRNA ligase [Candidatus Gracilibacteria bacterium]